MTICTTAAQANLAYMATGSSRTTRRRSRGDTFLEEDGGKDVQMPATKRRREEKKVPQAPVSAAQAQAGLGGGGGRGPNVQIAIAKRPRPAYEEDDDGFMFTRKSRAGPTTRSLRSVAAEPSAPIPAATAPLPPPPPRQGTPPGDPFSTPSRQPRAQIAAKIQRPAVGKQHPPPEPQPPAQSRARRQPQPQQHLTQARHGHPAQVSQNHSHHQQQQDRHVSRPRLEKVPKTFGFEQSMEDAGLRPVTPSPPRHRKQPGKNAGIEKVAIPISDTPIIQRNKQFRKDGGGGGGGSRRSSLGLRGRRASSLMDNGQVADPHHELEPESFYKHIDAEMVEPRRMKQLLMWCAKRAMTPPSLNKSGGDGDGNAHAIARIIEDEIMKDLLEKAELSNWFKRDAQPERKAVVKKPNPRNIDNIAKIQECEDALERLKLERKAWESIAKLPDAGGTLPVPLSLPTPPLPAPLLPDSLAEALKELFPPAAPSKSESAPGSGSNPEQAPLPPPLPPPPDDPANLLTDRESTFLTTTLPTLTTAISHSKSYLDGESTELEVTVDTVDDALHRLGQLGQKAEKVAGEALKVAERALRVKDEKVKKTAGTEGLGVREVLRSLSRMEG